MESKTIEDYCRLIEKLDDGSGTRSTDISRDLGLSKNTVALTLQKLSLAGYISMKRYGRVRLTKRGTTIARKMNFKHRVLETFLSRKLGIGKKRIHDEACLMEHWVSDDTARRLYVFLGRPKTDPHGKKIK